MLLLLLASLALANDARESAITALAEGRPDVAIRTLERALSSGEDAELRCLLARASLRAGRPDAAIAAADRVPQDAACRRVAEGIRAEALAVAGDPAASAQAWADLGERALGPERHAQTADRLIAWAEEAATDNPDHARRLLGAALRLELSPPRMLDVARRMARLDDPEARWPLLRALATTGLGEADRLLLAPLLDVDDGLALLAELPDSPAVLATAIIRPQPAAFMSESAA